MKIKYVILAGLCLLSLGHVNGQEASSPFGVCMHLDGGDEYVKMPENLRMARNAGIRWIRADFSWGSVEGPQGNWHFDRIDRMVEETEKLCIQLLPLLGFNVSWANPAYKHLDAWLVYVEKVVTRYKDKVRCWEVWNEHDLYPRFWDQPEDGENYALLLKATYQKIKEIDPNLTVVYAGTAGLPVKFIEKSFVAGADRAFDKMAVHPYRPLLNSWEATIRFKDDIDKLRALMTKYNAGDKGIWFTEIGLSSMANVAIRGKDVFHEIKAETGDDWKVAVVCDDDFPVDPAVTAQDIRSIFPSGFRLDTLQILDFLRIRMSDYDAVFFPPSDNIPMHINQLLTRYLMRYMRGGGKIFYCTRNGNIFYCGDAKEKEVNQAVFISQTICLTLRFGIEKYFLYEMESPVDNFFDREDNFGLTRQNLIPKPAYHAYATLSNLFPEGSKIDTSIEWRQKDCCVISWKQPDGTRVWAVWSPEGPQKVNVKIGKGLRRTLHFLGGEMPDVTESAQTLDTILEITYLVGPETLVIQ